jgi:hypothetical protein
MKKLYIVGIHSNIAGGNDHVYVRAENPEEALKIGEPMLDKHKLIPDFLNNYSRIYVDEACLNDYSRVRVHEA